MDAKTLGCLGESELGNLGKIRSDGSGGGSDLVTRFNGMESKLFGSYGRFWLVGVLTVLVEKTNEVLRIRKNERK